MKLSELIAQLQKAHEEHGDFLVTIAPNGPPEGYLQGIEATPTRDGLVALPGGRQLTPNELTITLELTDEEEDDD